MKKSTKLWIGIGGGIFLLVVVAAILVNKAASEAIQERIAERQSEKAREKAMADSLAARIPIDSTLSVTYNWSKVRIVDEFGDDTGERALQFDWIGRFSNSATNGDQLCGKIQKEADGEYYWVMNEYCSHFASLGYETTYGMIQVKIGDKEKQRYQVTHYPERGWFKANSKLRKALDKAPAGTEIQVSIAENKFSDYGSSQYLFSFPAIAADSSYTYTYE